MPSHGNLKYIILTSFFLSFILSCNSAFYYPDSKVYSDPNKLSLNYHDIYYKSRSGNKLHGRFFPSDSIASKGLFINFHGNAENLSSHYLSWIWITKMGYDYFLWDYSGYGESEGTPNREDLFYDGLSTLKYVVDSLHNPEKLLILTGQSLGGAILYPVIAEFEQKDIIDLLIIESSFPSYQGIGRSILAKSWVTWLFQPLAFILVSDEYSPKDYFGAFPEAKTWLLHCKDDPVVPFDQGLEYAKGIPNARTTWNSSCGHTRSFASLPENRKSLIFSLDSIKKNK